MSKLILSGRNNVLCYFIAGLFQKYISEFYTRRKCYFLSLAGILREVMVAGSATRLITIFFAQ